MNCLEGLKLLDENSIDLTVTSPPYDGLRNYNGYSFDFENIAKELYRVTKEGGVVAWIVGDATIKGSETLTSFKQALYFKEIGFNVHDTMIFEKGNSFGTSGNPPCRYSQNFEYMFILSKGKPKTFNPIKVPCVKAGSIAKGKTRKNRQSDGKAFDEQRYIEREVNKTKIASNIFKYQNGFNHTTKDKIAFKHPAIFPEKLAEDHILSWSNEDDVVMDIFSGSGTTHKMAKLHNRNFIGFEISEEYIEIENERLEQINL
jgi:site-specific DNA-methyltransferase (adenine-specific)